MTVVSCNGDTSKAGTVLFNSNYIEGAQNYNTVQTFFYYRSMEIDSVPDKYVVSDALGTVLSIFDPPAKGKASTYAETYTVATFRDDHNDSTSDTTNRVLDFEDIVKGIALPSDITQSLLWIADGHKKPRKFLVDKFLKALSDQSSTGTTTTYE